MIIDPDVYFEDALEKQRLRSSIKCPRQQPNYNKLNTERMIVPITLNVRVRHNLVIRDRFDWDLSRPTKSPYIFAQKMGEALGLSESDQQEIADSILEQIITHIEKYTIQTRTRIPRKLEEHAANNMTCLQCDSILYSSDYCRACGVSLEKLRQKYGPLTGPQEGNGQEDEFVPRQTERQKTLESTRRRQEPSSGWNRKSCTRCGDSNHPLSIECKQCSKPISKHKKIRNLNQALTYQFWKYLNRDSKFAQMVLRNDTLKEEDFASMHKLYEKLKLLLAECEQPPVSVTPFEVNQVLGYLDYCYEQILTNTPLENLHTQPYQQKDIDVNSLNFSEIHQAQSATETPTPSNYSQIDYRKKIIKTEVPGSRRRGRPRKYPLPETVAQNTLENQEPVSQAKMKESGDQNMSYCGVCRKGGELICCEVCPSVFHLNCVNLRGIPQGKWMCFFCRLVKDGVEAVRYDDHLYARRLNEIVKPNEDWREQAKLILGVLLMHPCSADLAPEGKSPEIPPQDLSSVKQLLAQGHYKSLEEVDSDIRQVLKTFSKKNKKKNQTLYQQAFNLQLFHNKVLSELQALVGIQVNTQPINFPVYKDPYKQPKFN